MTVDPNWLFQAVGSRRSRIALGRLREHDGPLSLADLAREVAAVEHDRPPVDVPAEAVQCVHLGLYHCDVPKLEDHGLVEHDREHDLVSISGEGADVADALAELGLA